MRLFFAAFPTAEVRRRIASVSAALDLPIEARRVPPEKYHMTLAFAGEVSRAQGAVLRVVGAAVRCPQFEVCFDAFEHWPKSEVVVAPVRECPAALIDLHEALAHFPPPGLAAGPVAFRPHVTLARKVMQAPVPKAMPKFSWTVRDFQLVRSARTADGSVYTVVDSWPLLDNAQRAL